MNDIIELTPSGLFCRSGDFYIDPWRPVKRAIITHAHADHAKEGSLSYLCTRESKPLLTTRLGSGAQIETLEYGQALSINAVRLSLHPAGHILGSAQVRIEKDGAVCVVSGDYKRDVDSTCLPFEPLRCHTFISECTFGLPIFRWPDPNQVMADINSWWRSNRDEGRTSILFAYALGKAQRILGKLDTAIGPILTHGAVEKVNQCYRDTGINLPQTHYVGEYEAKDSLKSALVIAPPSADHPAWMRRFPQRSRAFASGWMRIRGNRRRRAVDRGFILSDHSDWDGLIQTIQASGAHKILLTHGYATELARWLQPQGYDAEAIPAVDGNQTDLEGDVQ